MKTSKLLYINNYNCKLPDNDKYPSYHYWGIDYLNKFYNVQCAKVPNDLIRKKVKGVGFLNRLYKSLILLIRYWNYPIVYSACGDLTDMFALVNVLHWGKRRLFKIQHHGNTILHFPKGYEKIFFISDYIASLYPIDNKIILHWGGENHGLRSEKTGNQYEYDFISAGKSGRDHSCMMQATFDIKVRAVIVTDINDCPYNPEHLTLFSGMSKHKNSINDEDVQRLYIKSRYIVVPIVVRNDFEKDCLSGLTSFIDAVSFQKPVLISDNTNMGVDVEKLHIGFTYKAGDMNDMRDKMLMMMQLTNMEYYIMQENMRKYFNSHNYHVFCEELYNAIL